MRLFLILAVINAVPCNADPNSGPLLFPVPLQTNYTQGFTEFGYGYMDSDGNVVIDEEFAKAGYFQGEYAIVDYNFLPAGDMLEEFESFSQYLINKKGEKAAEFNRIAGYGGGVWTVAESRNRELFYGFTNESFKLTIKGNYSWLGVLSEGLAPAQISGQDGSVMWCYIDRDGKVVLKPDNIDYAYGFQNGLARVRHTGTDYSTYGFIDKKGSVVIPAVYREASDFSCDIIPVQLDDSSYVFINKQGEKVFDTSYAHALPFSGDMAAVSIRRKEPKLGLIYSYGYIDKKGKWIITPRFDLAESFSEGFAVTGMYSENGWKYHYIDTQGNDVFKREFKSAALFYNGLALVTYLDKEGTLMIGYINTQGKFVWKRPV